MSNLEQHSSAEGPQWGWGWEVGLRVWVERAGHSILGPGRLELLEGIHQHRSISAAAPAGDAVPPGLGVGAEHQPGGR